VGESTVGDTVCGPPWGQLSGVSGGVTRGGPSLVVPNVCSAVGGPRWWFEVGVPRGRSTVGDLCGVSSWASTV
jgi:hypothetical protein